MSRYFQEYEILCGMECLYSIAVLTVCKPVSAHGSSQCHQVSAAYCDFLSFNKLFNHLKLNI